MKKFISFIALATLSAAVFCQALFTGDGGKDLSIQVESPEFHNIGEDSPWIPDFVMNTIIDDIGKYSAITIVDVQNANKVAEAQKRDENGLFDDYNLVEAGAFIVAKNVLLVSLTQNASSYDLSVRINDKKKNTFIASYSKHNCSSQNLMSGLVIKEAVADLLGQLNVNLTAEGKKRLLDVKSAENAKSIEAQKLNAQGNLALQKNGSAMEALSYFIQASLSDASLQRAKKSIYQTSAAMSVTDIGTFARTSIQLQNDFLKLIDNIKENNRKNPPYYIVFDPKLELGHINYEKETVNVVVKIAIVRNLENVRLCNSVLQLYKKTKEKYEKIGDRNWGYDIEKEFHDMYGYGGMDIPVSISDKNGKVLGRKNIRCVIPPSDRCLDPPHFCSWSNSGWYDDRLYSIEISPNDDIDNIVLTIETDNLNKLSVDDYLHKVLVPSFAKEEVYPGISIITLPLPLYENESYYNRFGDFIEDFCKASVAELSIEAFPEPRIPCHPGYTGWAPNDLAKKLNVDRLVWYDLNFAMGGVYAKSDNTNLNSGNYFICDYTIIVDEKKIRVNKKIMGDKK